MRMKDIAIACSPYMITAGMMGTKREWRERVSPVRTDPKVGRNSPCPCGSGKKVKKCCTSKK